MSDKELLELAAKAAFPSCAHLDYPLYWVRDCVGEWNPLTDDGDALRLAVKLGFEVSCGDNGRDTASGEVFSMTLVVGEYTDCLERHNTDPYAATRRAIVRAAAEIGRSMK